MGFLDTAFADGASIISGRSSKRRHKKHRSRSRSRSRSSSRHRHSSKRGLSSIFGSGHDKHHNSSRSSFFGMGGNNSRSSFFGGKQSSYYKRSPRQGFMQSSWKKLKRLFRDLVHWAKRHPYKVFFLVIMPLITGGALTALLARFGLKIPGGIEKLMGVAGKAATGDSAGLVSEAVRMASNFGGGGNDATVRVEREAHAYGYAPEGFGGGGGGGGGGAEQGWGTAAGNLADIAKKFM